MKDLLGRDALAKKLGVNPMTIWRWTRYQQLPHFRFGKLYKYSLSDVLSWAKKKGVK